MIPEDHKTAVISNGMHFMRSITEAYGAEEGLRLWDTIANALDPDVKGQIFMAMVTGNYNDRVHLKGLHPYGQENAVACIKAIREWDKRGLGLKEAKDMYDRVAKQRALGERSNEYLHVMHEKYHHAVLALRNAGFNV
jgi:hypothetical protein